MHAREKHTNTHILFWHCEQDFDIIMEETTHFDRLYSHQNVLNMSTTADDNN